MTKPDDDDLRQSADKASSIHMKAMNGDGLTDKDAEEYAATRGHCIYGDMAKTCANIPPSVDMADRLLMSIGAYIAKQELQQLKPMAKRAAAVKAAQNKRIIRPS